MAAGTYDSYDSWHYGPTDGTIWAAYDHIVWNAEYSGGGRGQQLHMNLLLLCQVAVTCYYSEMKLSMRTALEGDP